MEYAIQRCCATAVFLEQYNVSTDAVMKRLGVNIVDIKEFNCCGYPAKSCDYNAYALASARNLSLAEKRNLDVMTFCNCCYGSLKHVDDLLRRDPEALEGVNEKLQKEDLRFGGSSKIKHLLEVLYFDIGIERIRERLVRSFEGTKIAVHYGCHILRPGEVANFGAPGSAAIFDELVKITGAELVPWDLQSRCCGASMRGVDDDLSDKIVRGKIADAKKAGADCVCSACAYCQLQLDRGQRMMADQNEGDRKNALPSILFTQLLGLSLGIDPKELSVEKSEMSLQTIVDALLDKKPEIKKKKKKKKKKVAKKSKKAAKKKTEAKAEKADDPPKAEKPADGGEKEE
ncbi:conserved hypothetical protein [Candidatus Desulfarcum epimagneticum]|uniref:Cysteine-rich domain-containing protein n=1 Tax=uncultured Desulfobacteraceae bacterium TaxID=218296 RepID=A0A484HJ57_9BACT|nr:conserved hypothetical protein [uncultured Desulfobacteraceae bacterium]